MMRQIPIALYLSLPAEFSPICRAAYAAGDPESSDGVARS